MSDTTTEPTNSTRKPTNRQRVEKLITSAYRKLRRTDTPDYASGLDYENGVLAEELQQSPSGWVVPGRPWAVPDDSPAFVCKELALRYGLMQSAAHAEYVRLCDSAGQPDAAERITRVVEYLDEMDRLRNLERRIQPLLPENAEKRQELIED